MRDPIKIIIGPLAFFLVSPKVSREICTNKLVHVETYLSQYLCGFRKGYHTEKFLIVMLEKWRKALDKPDVAGTLLTDLLKAFDCLNHEVLIAKLEAYGFDRSSLDYIYSYLHGLL